jgi:CheY-like chemotaxis protein
MWEAAQDDWRRKLRDGRPRIAALKPDESLPKKTDSPKRILVVEDDLDSARSMFMLIADMGHSVEYAINGYVAVDRVRRFRPDIVLLDLGLPGMDGFEVCSQIKNDPELKHVRVIVITGYAHDEYRVRSKAAGCELHLVKPVSLAVIEHLLN